MAFKTTWNINKYVYSTEPSLQSTLKKCFMETHKMKYPEDKLVCLAQSFCNIEFLGCRYIPDVMKTVEILSSEVPEIVQYRKRKQKAIKRTFVAASDAVKKKMKPANNNKQLQVDSRQYEETLPLMRTALTMADQMLLNRAKKQPGYKGKLILFEYLYSKTLPYTVVQQSVLKNNSQISLKSTGRNKGSLMEFAVVIDGETVVNDFAESIKTAREVLGPVLLSKIKEHCFTVVVKSYLEGEQVEKDLKLVKHQLPNNNVSLPADNIGFKMMKMMGWSGKGLGKKEDGIEKPVEATENISRLGLGRDINQNTLRLKIKQMLEKYITTQQTQNLIFSSDFSNDERKLIHSLANSYKLKSKSYGKDKNRQLIVSRKLTTWEIVEELLAVGDSSVNYDLIRPTKL